MDKFSNISLKNIAWFNDMNKNNRLDMRPPYQRNAVWTVRQKSYLIDSILNGYPIPELIVQEDIDEKGQAKYIIVDGQQRMRAVFEFLDDQYGLNKEDSPEFDGVNFSGLNIELKKKFFKYNFIVRSIPDMPESDIREIFKRLNRNVVALNPQEIRKAAYSGDLIKMVTALSANSFWSDMKLFTANDIKRMRDEQFISELALAIVYGITNKKDKLETFYEESEVSFPQKNKVREAFELVFDTLTPFASQLCKTRWKNKTDFYTLFLGILNLKHSLPLNNEKSNRLVEGLVEFSSNVTKCLEVNESNNFDYPDYVKDFAKGVRAATDLNARTLRQNALQKFISNTIGGM